MNEYRDEDKTDWLPSSVAPVREGVYERRYYCEERTDPGGLDETCRFSKFATPVHNAETEAWYVGAQTVDEATSSHMTSAFQLGHPDFKWRGLKVDPNTVVITPEVHVVEHNVPGLALDSGEFIPAEALNESQPEEDLF